MIGLVLDASAALAWLLGEGDAIAHRIAVRAAASPLIVPAIWHAEIANALARAQRRRRIRPAEAGHAIGLLNELEIETDYPVPAIERIYSLAIDTGLTSYDALYLELATRTRAELGTLDSALASAARKAGVQLAF